MTAANPRMKIDKVCETTTKDERRANREAEVRRSGEAWEKGFRHLQSYYQAQRDCLVPYAYRAPTSGFRLGEWVSKQRDDKFMLPSFRQRLNALGFEWDQHAIGILKFCLKPDVEREQRMKDTASRRDWNQWIETNFKKGRCVFGSLVYPCKPYLTDIYKSARIYAEQVVRRSCKSHPDPLRRVFVAEQTSGEEIRKTRVHPIPINGEIHHVLIKQPQGSETPVISRNPDIPHIHFLMEVPNGCDPADFVELCEERWFRMNKKDGNWTSQLAKVEVVANLPAVARYITKEFVTTKGENIILTHATLLR